MTTRILHVIPSLGRGGAERQLTNLVSNSNRQEYEHVVCCLRRPDDLAQEIERAGCRVIRLNVGGKRGWFRAARTLVPLIRTIRPHVVHSWLYNASISARLAYLAGPRLPLVASLQGPDYDPDTIRAADWPGAKVRVLLWVDRLSSRWSRTEYVACSRYVERCAITHQGVPLERIRVIYNAVDAKALRCDPSDRQQLRQALEIPEDAVVFLNVGRLDAQKGQECLLRASQQIRSAAPAAFIAIAGDGPLGARLRALTEHLCIADRVRFLGVRSDLAACLEMADAFVFPSMFEGLPLALIEAMCKGLPCIATRIGPHEELITHGQNGVLVQPGSVDELARAMLDLCLDADKRTRIGKQAQLDSLALFDIRETLPAWERLYQELACRENAVETSSTLAPSPYR